MEITSKDEEESRVRSKINLDLQKIERKDNSFTDPGRTPRLIGISPNYKAKIDPQHAE